MSYPHLSIWGQTSLTSLWVFPVQTHCRDEFPSTDTDVSKQTPNKVYVHLSLNLTEFILSFQTRGEEEKVGRVYGGMFWVGGEIYSYRIYKERIHK